MHILQHDHNSLWGTFVWKLDIYAGKTLHQWKAREVHALSCLTSAHLDPIYILITTHPQ